MKNALIGHVSHVGIHPLLGPCRIDAAEVNWWGILLLLVLALLATLIRRKFR